MEKVFIGSNCPECLRYKTYECDGKIRDCKAFNPLSFRTPLLLVLLDSCPEALNQMLENFNAVIIETNQYPYFRLSYVN